VVRAKKNRGALPRFHLDSRLRGNDVLKPA
jgi:hypothetical protein